MPRFLPLTLLLAAALAASACSGGDDTSAGNDQGGFAGLAERATDEIREEFANEDLDLGRGDDGLPPAKLTPQGDLVIDGQAVAMTDEQRAIALGYRDAVGEVAMAGARIGLQGAALAGDAMKLAAASVLSGDGKSVEEQLKGKTDAIEAEAKALCDRLPDLLAQQQRFAAAVPEFAPYATMSEDDFDKCDGTDTAP